MVGIKLFITYEIPQNLKFKLEKITKVDIRNTKINAVKINYSGRKILENFRKRYETRRFFTALEL